MNKSLSNTDSTSVKKSEQFMVSDSSKAFEYSKNNVKSAEGQLSIDLWYNGKDSVYKHIQPYYFKDSLSFTDKVLPYYVEVEYDTNGVTIKSNQPIKNIKGNKKSFSDQSSKGSGSFSSSINSGSFNSDSTSLGKDEKGKGSETNSRSFNWSFTLIFIGCVTVVSLFIYLLLKRKR